MRRIACLMCAFILVLMVSAQADTIPFNGMEFSTEAEYLNMGDTRILDLPSFYSFLKQFPNLKKVDMFATPVRKSQIDILTTRFPDIEFGWTIQFAEHQVRTDVTAYSTLHYSNAQKHGNADIGLLRYCKKLKALDFGHNSVTDLSFLYDLPDLRVLIIACNQVEDITPIGSLKHLEYLELFTNNIRDISPLKGLNNLMDLNISYNYIQDITPILTLKNLKRLWTSKSINRGMNVSLSYAQINQIREAIPGVEINNLSNPTGGTWREHPHFDVIHRMFRAGSYEPFEDSFQVDEETTVLRVSIENEDGTGETADKQGETAGMDSAESGTGQMLGQGGHSGQESVPSSGDTAEDPCSLPPQQPAMVIPYIP